MKKRNDNRQKTGNVFSAGKRRYRSQSLLIVILLLASLIALNAAFSALETRNGWRTDWSFNSLTTHSDQTREILEQLDKPVHIYAMYRRGEEDAPLMELLNRYAAASSLVTWEQTDPRLNPALLSLYSTETQPVTEDSLIVTCEETGRWRVLTAESFVSLGLDTETGSFVSAGWTYERSITEAIRYTTRDRIPKVVIARGHGELGEDVLQSFTELLQSNQYEVAWSDLTGTDLPEAGDLLVFFSPLRDLTETELEALRAFANQGGSFLFTCDYTDPVSRMERYSSLLRSYGIIPLDGIVCADPGDQQTYYQNSRIQLIPEMCSTDITLELLSAGMSTVLLPGCRAFETPGENDRNLLTAEVLRSADSAYLKQIDAGTTSMERKEDDPAGPFTLALQARRITEGGSVSRAFAVGCSSLMTADQIWAMTDSQQLIIRIMEFLVDLNGSGTQITEKDALRPALGMGSTGAGSVLLVALPTLVLCVALAVLLPRRNR